MREVRLISTNGCRLLLDCDVEPYFPTENDQSDTVLRHCTGAVTDGAIAAVGGASVALPFAHTSLSGYCSIIVRCIVPIICSNASLQ